MLPPDRCLIALLECDIFLKHEESDESQASGHTATFHLTLQVRASLTVIFAMHGICMAQWPEHFVSHGAMLLHGTVQKTF